MSKKNKVISGVVFGLLLIVIWVIVFNVKSNQLDSYVKNLSASTDVTKKKDNDNDLVKGMKIVIDDKKYTVKEFLELDEYPAVVEVIIAYDNNEMKVKNCYISYNEEVKEFTYRDDTYGRILLPISMSNKQKKED